MSDRAHDVALLREWASTLTSTAERTVTRSLREHIESLASDCGTAAAYVERNDSVHLRALVFDRLATRSRYGLLYTLASRRAAQLRGNGR